MKRIKNLGLMVVILLLCLCTTGCKQDDMEDIEIIVTNYPNEYIVNAIYGKHATITSIYPDGVDIDTFKITNKQKKDYASKGLFVYNGLLEKERNLAVDLLDINPDLKIIDSSYVLETDYSYEELWLNPSSLLMMANNVRMGLKEYVTSSYLKKEIDENYNNLKIKLSELDADYRVAVDNTKEKIIVVNNPALKYLEKFGLTVICLDDSATDKDIVTVKTLVNNGSISYIYKFEDEELTDASKEIIAYNPNINPLNFNKIDILSDIEREDDKNYITLMNENLELLKQELYQ